MHPDIRRIMVGSSEYLQMIALRMRVLLDPIGIPASYINAEKEKDDVLLGAFNGEVMVACCILSNLAKSTIQLRQMAVDADVQRTGTGKRLMAYAEEWGRSQNIERIILHAREAVVGFYQNCGYEITGDRFEEVGIGHYRMEKQIKKQPELLS